MTSSSPAPKLPLWIFLLTDAILVGIAFFIGTDHARPWSEDVTFAIVACIIAGAVVGLTPIIAYYERQKNETLDDRQRGLEALARTVSESAEQISIAAGGLHEIADLAQRNLKHAEQLPHKLQEKIAEFQAQLANATDAEKEELEKELEELRSTETERLQSTSDKIARTASEFAKIEAATQQHLAAANEALSKLAFGTAGAIGKAQAAAEQALSHARQEAARTVGEAVGNAVAQIETAKAKAARELAADFDANTARIKEATRELASLLSQLHAAAAATTGQPAVPAEASAAGGGGDASAAPIGNEHPVPQADNEHTAPKRSRKPRREEPAPAPEPAAVSAAPSEPAASRLSEPITPAPEPAPATPVQTDATEMTPALPAPAPAASASVAGAETEPAPVSPAAAPASTEPVVSPEPKSARKRATRKSEDEQPGLGLDLGDSHQNGDGDSGAAAGIVERVLSSDGATRLIVTAYIGIGNRLFIRGSGPGLSWEKGTPLQFISIGKWRWETNDASAPVHVKLFKNDEQESAGLGELTIDPGHQHEVTATFS